MALVVASAVGLAGMQAAAVSVGPLAGPPAEGLVAATAAWAGSQRAWEAALVALAAGSQAAQVSVEGLVAATA